MAEQGGLKSKSPRLKSFSGSNDFTFKNMYFRIFRDNEKSQFYGQFMPLVSQVFHTIVTVSIVLKSTVRMIASILKYQMSMFKIPFFSDLHYLLEI